MSFLFAQPQLLMEAATDLAGIGSTISAANTAAALPTTSVLAAGADEVSTAMAAVFGAHARQYQAMSAQAANLHSQFVQTMNSAAGAYAGAESANAAPLQVTDGAALNTVNSSPRGLVGGRGLGAGGKPRLGPVGGPARSAASNAGNVRSAVPGRVGVRASAIATGGAGGLGGARVATDKKQALTINRSRPTGAATFGAGGKGGVGGARDLGATYGRQSDSGAAKQSFRKFGSGSGGSTGGVRLAS